MRGAANASFRSIRRSKKILDAAGVRGKFGVEPALIPDLPRAGRRCRRRLSGAFWNRLGHGCATAQSLRAHREPAGRRAQGPARARTAVQAACDAQDRRAALPQDRCLALAGTYSNVRRMDGADGIAAPARTRRQGAARFARPRKRDSVISRVDLNCVINRLQPASIALGMARRRHHSQLMLMPRTQGDQCDRALDDREAQASAAQHLRARLRVTSDEIPVALRDPGRKSNRRPCRARAIPRLLCRMMEAPSRLPC